MTTPERLSFERLIEQCQAVILSSYETVERARESCARAEQLCRRAAQDQRLIEKHGKFVRTQGLTE